MKIIRVIFVISVLCAPFYAQQVNQDIVPASPGLYLGHTNQRWNGYFNNADIYNLTINGSPIGTAGVGLPQISIPNGANCTTLNGLVEFDGNGQAQTASLSSTKVIGVAVSGAGCSGNVLVQYAAIVNCTTDGSTLINDRIAASNSIPGDCMDIGPISIPGIQTVGLVTAVSSGAGQLTSFDLFTGDTISPSSSSGSGVVSVSPCVGPIGYAATAAAIVSWDCNTSLDGSGNAGFKKVTVTGSGAGKIDFGTGSSPGNPSAGLDRVYADSTSGLLSCLTSSGNNCLSPFLNPFDYAGSDICARIVAGMTANLTTGGTFWIPQGTYVCTTQLSVPFNSGPVQPSFRITGVGPSHDSSAAAGGNLVYGGTILDLQNNAATAKIDTRGSGYLEIDHVTLQDSASDCAAFLFTTNTVLHVHDVRFNGTSTNCNDGIILGGTTTNVDATSTAAFQGYGTVIRENHFQNIQRAVKWQTFANNVQVINNVVWSGSGFSTGGAFELNPNGAAQAITGNVVTGNLIEVTKYLYGVWIHGTGAGAGSLNNFFAGNGCFDATGLTTACYKFEASSDFNYVIDSFHTASIAGITDVDGFTTYLSPAQSSTSIFPQQSKYTNASTPIQIAKAGGNSAAYDILNTTTNDEIYQQVVSTAQPWQLELKSAGGTAENVFQFLRTAATSEYKIGKSADTTIFIEPDSTGADVKIRSRNAGNVVWLCGGNGLCNTWVDTNGQIHNSTATGTAPLVIASTTAVPNLTVQNCNNCAFTGTPPSTPSGPVSGSWNCVNVTPVTVNTNTAADQNMMACTIPAATLNTTSKTLRVYAAGVYSTPSLSTSQMTMKAKLCTVSGCGSGTVITPISIQSTALGTVQITNDNFSMHSNITTQTTGASSAYEAHGDFLIDLSTLTTAADNSFGDTNTATVGTIDATGQLFLQMTFAFSNASGSNSATQRQLIVDTVN